MVTQLFAACTAGAWDRLRPAFGVRSCGARRSVGQVVESSDVVLRSPYERARRPVQSEVDSISGLAPREDVQQILLEGLMARGETEASEVNTPTIRASYIAVFISLVLLFEWLAIYAFKSTC